MNANLIRRANDIELVKSAIKYHWAASEDAYALGDFDQARMHRRLVDSLRDQLRRAGVLAKTQCVEQLRTIDISDDLVRVDPNSLIRDDD
jgi:hypothetical protein